MEYKLYEYELWGNDEDGYDCNDIFFVESLELEGEPSDMEILKAFKIDKLVVVDWNTCSENPIYLLRKSDEQPIGEIRIED